MKEIQPAAEDVCLMVILDAEALPGVHTPEALLQLLKNIRLHEVALTTDSVTVRRMTS